MNWDYAHIVELASAGLRDRATALAAEQATQGIDALGEIGLHPILRGGIARGPYAVLAEERYPPSRSKKKRTEGERCDIVVIDRYDSDERHASEHLADPLAAGTLFAHKGVDPEAALWVEVKVVHQWTLFDGGIRSNPAYSALLLREATSDVRKLAREPGIASGAVLIVMFTDRAETASHDLRVWRERCTALGLGTSVPFDAGFAITDRLGNGWCSVALVPVHRALVTPARSRG